MNLLTVSLIFLPSVIAIFGNSAKPTDSTTFKPKFKNVTDAENKQSATIEFELSGKDFADKKYGVLHREILDALNRRTTTEKIEQQTTQRATEPTTKTTTVTTAATVEKTTSSAGSTATEDLTSTATKEQTTTTGPTTATTYIVPNHPDPARRRRSLLSDETFYEDEDVFFFDLEDNKIKNGIIRVPVGLHKEGYNISPNRLDLYNVLIYMNNTGTLGSSVNLQVVKIYHGFPDDITQLPLLRNIENRSIWIYVPIVVTMGFLLLILLVGTLYFVMFRSNVRYVVQKYCRQVQVKGGSLNSIKKTAADRGPHPLSSPNGHLKSPHNNIKPDGVYPVILDANYDGWLIPMSEFYSEHSITKVPSREDFNPTN